MQQLFITYLLIFAMALMMTYLITPFLRFAALKFSVVDRKEDRKIHRKVVTKLGGIAIFIAVVFSTLAAFLLEYVTMKPEIGNYGAILIGSAIVLALGIYDDVKGANPFVKLAAQALAAIVLIKYDLYFRSITFPFGVVELGAWGIPLTLFFVILVTNSINLLDGVDGLAAGCIGIISLGIFLAVFFANGSLLTAYFSIAVAGAVCGFLHYNFYPAKIFMGDTGSLFLGFLVGALVIESSLRGVQEPISFIVPLCALLLPISDTLIVFFRRVCKRIHPFNADNRHLHYRLIRMGFSQRDTTLILYGVTGFFVSVGLAFQFIF